MISGFCNYLLCRYIRTWQLQSRLVLQPRNEYASLFDKDGENIDKEKTLNNSLSTVEIGGAYGIFLVGHRYFSSLLLTSVDYSLDFYGYFSELGILSFKVYNKFKVYEHKELARYREYHQRKYRSG